MTDATLKFNWLLEKAQKIVREQAQMLDEMEASTEAMAKLVKEK